ncbi:hypothetical protein ACVW00_000052 [Marmoricola sp. URHA0025 HA25]
MNAQHDGITEAVVGLAAEHDPAQLEIMLESLSNVQLRSLAAALATQIARDQEVGQAPPAPPSVTPTAQGISSAAHLCNVAIEAAAKMLGTTPEAAARTNGLTLPQIAEHFGRDDSSVIHAIRRTGERPRLAAAASVIAEDITSRYQQVIEERPGLRLIRDPETTSAAHKPIPQDLTVVAAAIEAAARKFGTHLELVRGPDRTRMVADARAVAMTAARIKGLSLPKIAADFDDRHHAVVLHSTRRVEKTPPLRELTEQIAKDIPKAAPSGTGGDVRHAVMLDGQVTTTPARGQQANRAVAGTVAVTQSAVAPPRRRPPPAIGTEERAMTSR